MNIPTMLTVDALADARKPPEHRAIESSDVPRMEYRGLESSYKAVESQIRGEILAGPLSQLMNTNSFHGQAVSELRRFSQRNDAMTKPLSLRCIDQIHDTIFEPTVIESIDNMSNQRKTR